MVSIYTVDNICETGIIFSKEFHCIYIYVRTCIGCAVLLCLVVCLTFLASSFLLSHLSLKHNFIYVQ